MDQGEDMDKAGNFSCQTGRTLDLVTNLDLRNKPLKMDKNIIDHGPNTKKVTFVTPIKMKNKVNLQPETRKSLLIVEITKYDDWFHQLTKFNSYQVKEKIDHLLDQINLEILSDKCFNILLRQVQHWYDENGDRESMTDFNYKIKAETEPLSGNKFIMIIEEYNEDDLIPESDDEDFEEIDIFENNPIKNYYESTEELQSSKKLDKNDLYDVTLACEDEQIKTQK